MLDRLSGVATFVEVAEAGSFAAAASRLGLTRSAVGKIVSRLEGRLGVQLIQRTTRTQRLTEDGQALFERAVNALAELEAAEAALDSGRREPIGRLRVSAPVLLGRRCVAPILLDLARQHPKLEVELSLSDRLTDLVADGVDIAVRRGPLQDSTGTMARRLMGQPMTVCAAPAYLRARGIPRTLDDLATHEVIAYVRGGRASPWRFPLAEGREREVTPRGRLRLDDLEAIADAAEAGLGLAWLPRWLVADRVRRKKLVGVLADVPPLVFDFYAVWPKTLHVASRVRVALSALADRLPAAVRL